MGGRSRLEGGWCCKGFVCHMNVLKAEVVRSTGAAQVTSQCSLRRYIVLSVSENKYRGTRYVGKNESICFIYFIFVLRVTCTPVHTCTTLVLLFKNMYNIK